MTLRRMLAAAIVVTALISPARAQSWANEGFIQYERFASVLKQSVNDPDSLVIEAMVIFRVAFNGYHACGQLRAKNVYGGYVRQNFVITMRDSMPVYVGPIPLNIFKNDCSGDVVYAKDISK